MKLPAFLKTVLKRVLGLLTMLLVLGICWTLSYWLTSWFFAQIYSVPQGLARQLIMSFAGFFIFVCSMFFITKIKWVRDRQNNFLNPIIHAMKMMAEGNFNVDLSQYDKQIRDDDHPYAQIVKSVHHMADSLGKMEDMRQEFISNVSHEIQSPLTSIRGFAHALKKDNLPLEERQHYLHIIELESIRLSRLSENLLKLTSLESEQVSVDLKPYRLDHQLRRIVLAGEPQWNGKNINMDISLEPVSLTADEDLLDQVWTNLLHNSIKFTPDGGTITISVWQTDDAKLAVKIADTGVGITNEMLLHVFERFYKADAARSREHGGSGLGLSIVKKIIDLHHGKIQVQSVPGQGTEITVEFAVGPSTSK